jgi:hypothetical protein
MRGEFARAMRRGAAVPGANAQSAKDRRRRLALVFFAVPWLALSGACRDSRSPEAGRSFAAYDSAGVRIVVSRSPAWRAGEAWLIPDSPLVSIGTVDGPAEYQLTDVRGVVGLSDGRIVVADGASNTLRAFGPDGRYLWSSGRKGQGPGDFVRLARLARYRGDSLLAFDFTVGRRVFSVIGPTGRFARSWHPQNPDASPGSLRFIGAWEDGTVAMSVAPMARPSSPPRVIRLPAQLLRYDADGGGVQAIGTFPGTEYYEGEVFAVRPLPWARISYLATFGTGTVVGTNDTYEVRLLSPTGAVQTIIRRSVSLRRITPSEQDAERERLRTARRAERATGLRGLPDSVLALFSADEERMFSEVPFPPTYPAYETVLAAQDGHLWVREFSAGGDADTARQRWTVFRPDGRMLGEVLLPGRFTLYEANFERVLGVQMDAMGVNFVRAFPIRRKMGAQ